MHQYIIDSTFTMSMDMELDGGEVLFFPHTETVPNIKRLIEESMDFYLDPLLCSD